MIVDENTTDESLVLYIREEDKEYFSYLIRRYERKLRSYLSKFSNSRDDIDDIIQETFIKTYTNLHAFKIDKKFSSWIYRIAHNTAINSLKRKKADVSIDENILLNNTLLSELNIIQELDRKYLAEKINNVINKLPDKYKYPFILYFYEEKTYQEISNILRKPKNTVGSLINRAKKILQEELQ